MSDQTAILEAAEGEERTRILKARALELARKPTSFETDGIEVLEFLLAGERFGVELLFIGQVIVQKGLTPIPCAPPHVAGAINVRGMIVPVIDLRVLFGLPAKQPSP